MSIPMLVEAPAATEPSANRASPVRNTRLRP